MYAAQVGDGLARNWNSRWFRMLIASLLAALVFSVSSFGASAGISWCRSDPVLLIDGELAQVLVAGPLTAPLQVTGPTEVVITVPEGVNADLLLTDLGFGRGWDVTIEESSELRKSRLRGTEVQIAVYVPTRTSEMPIRLEFAPRVVGLLNPANVEGNSNTWVELKTWF